MAKTFLAATDPKLITRTWEDVLVRFCDRSNANTRMRHKRVVRMHVLKQRIQWRQHGNASLPTLWQECRAGSALKRLLVIMRII